jgi:hypothetical protein
MLMADTVLFQNFNLGLRLRNLDTVGPCKEFGIKRNFLVGGINEYLALSADGPGDS